MQRNIGSSTLRDDGRKNIGTQPYEKTAATVMPYRDRCGKCGATRQDRQLGLESSPTEYVAAMVDVFREVRRVLRSDGTVWVNLGDSYATGTATPSKPSVNNDVGYWNNADRIGRSRIDGRGFGLKPKDLCGIPWRVAFALQADGWYLRSDIIWSKSNPMPESVTDRPTKSHEYLFLLAKSARYFFDADAVREDNSNPNLTEMRVDWRDRPNNGEWPSGTGGRMGSVTSGRNIRTVWTIATAPYVGSHFATFPPALVEPCIKAGTSERGVCPDCGAPWRRVVERERFGKAFSATKYDDTAQAGPLSRSRQAYRAVGMEGPPPSTTTGWQPTCTHDATPVPATVMDPFAGSGTTALVANRLSRRAILIDLSADYLAQSLVRNQQSVVGL